MNQERKKAFLKEVTEDGHGKKKRSSRYKEGITIRIHTESVMLGVQVSVISPVLVDGQKHTR